jgi:5'-nucleotidase
VQTLVGRAFFAGTAGLLLLAMPVAHALDIALTNDDGWSSLGVQSMKAALVAAGHQVTLAAPLDEQSGSSAAINTGGLVIRKQRDDDGALEFSVAVVALSSTFNGAVPAIAVSTDAICTEATPECQGRNAEHFGRVAQFVVEVIAQLEQKSGPLGSEPGLLPAGLGLNINYPPVEVPAGVKIARQGRTATFGGTTSTLKLGCYGPCASLPVGGQLPGGITGIAADETPDVRNADTTAFGQGYVTIVPIEADYTAEPAERLNALLRLSSLLSGLYH